MVAQMNEAQALGDWSTFQHPMVFPPPSKHEVFYVASENSALGQLADMPRRQDAVAF